MARDGNFSDKPDLTGIDQPVDAAAQFRLDEVQVVGLLVFSNVGPVLVRTAETIASSASGDTREISSSTHGYRYAIQRRDGADLAPVGDVLCARVAADGESTLATTINIQGPLTEDDADNAAAFLIKQSQRIAGRLDVSPKMLTFSTSSRDLANSFAASGGVMTLKSSDQDLVAPARRTTLSALDTMLSALDEIQHDPMLVAEAVQRLTAILAPTMRQVPKIKVDYSAKQLADNVSTARRRLRQELQRANAAEHIRQSTGGRSWGFALRHADTPAES
jgi:hypothetical protein